MVGFYKFIETQFKISFVFFVVGLMFGLFYSLNLLGFYIDCDTLNPVNMRSIHISLMLYGFVPLMLSYLPFMLMEKEIANTSKEGIYYLSLYTVFWYIFLIFMIVSLLFGNTRGLAFYDFPYALNFILAIAGVFYIVALYKYIKVYQIIPIWVKVSLVFVGIAPVMLLVLMNPIIGQVESTISGPHGDNTLGMSLALIPIYYLIIKLLNKDEFIARWNILWVIPTLFYFGSVFYRSFIDQLSYNQEWFLQYLTLLYIPLLYRWYKDTQIDTFAKKALLISILAFLFVDIQGNILFIPDIRWIFHRNDLIIAHAHIAMGIGVFFMVIAMFASYIDRLKNFSFYAIYIMGILGMFIVLSISGISQAELWEVEVFDMWLLRTLFAFVVIYSAISLFDFRIQLSPLKKYNLIGFLSDGFGGILLILMASFIYPLFGFEFSGKYEYIVFMFVAMTGVIHLSAFIHTKHEQILTTLTVIIRVCISSVFFALYLKNILGIEALLIGIVDFGFVVFYLMFFYNKEMLCQELH
ncbi:MAG: hypothetical protein M0P43_00295 [Arcobacteraceae bacterium]|nr:hypothetical protein [Arcobacteraceae bacterium]